MANIGVRALSPAGFIVVYRKVIFIVCYLKKQRERHASGMRLRGVRPSSHTQVPIGTFIVKVSLNKFPESSVKIAQIGWRGLIALPLAMPNGRVFNFKGVKRRSVLFLFSSNHPQMHSGQAICVAFFSRWVVSSTPSNCDSSSVGRAQPSHGWGREFEPRLSLTRKGHFFIYLSWVSKTVGIYRPTSSVSCEAR